MANARTVVEVLNRSGSRIGEIRNLYPINESGMILQYSQELSDWGTCKFRVATSDPSLTSYGDILEPHVNQIRIKRGQKVVWQGAIVDNTERNKNYVEVVANEYLWYLDKVLVRRDTTVNPGDGKKHLRVFDSGTLKTAVTNVFNQGVTDSGNSLLSGASIGTVNNPNFPAIYSLSGAWTFSSTFALQFDYHTALYVLKAFGIYSEYDFELTSDLTFNFKKRIGNQLFKFSFEYGQYGNIVDYNIPRLGKRMVNDLVGMAATDQGELLHVPKSNEGSINTYGKLEGVSAYMDVKNKDTLKGRVKEELRLISRPENSPINVVLDEKGAPFGQYGIGDIVKVKIKDHNIDFDDWRMIVGTTVSLHNTGREITVVQTNKPSAGVLT